MSRSIVFVAAGVLSVSGAVALVLHSKPANAQTASLSEPAATALADTAIAPTAAAPTAVASETTVDVSVVPEFAPAPRGFLDPRRLPEISLPERASAATLSLNGEVAAQRTLVRKAEADLIAAAEVRRRAEELSRKFVSDHGLSPEPQPPRAAPLASPANLAVPAPIPVLRAARALNTPEAPDSSGSSPGAATVQPVSGNANAAVGETVRVAPDLLGLARQQAADAEARAAVERAARVAAEEESQRTIERAAAAMAKAQAEARAASRRAAEAEARALKVTAAAERKTANATATVAAIGKDKALAKATAPGASTALPPANGAANGPASGKAPPTITVVGRTTTAAKPSPGFLSASSIPTSPPPKPFSLGSMLGLQ